MIDSNSNIVKEVKRKAKVGEWVKIVNPYCPYVEYKFGTLMRVTDEITDVDSGVYCSSGAYDNLWLFNHEYVVLENYINEGDFL